MSVAQVLDYANKLGVISVLVLLVVALLKGWLAPPSVINALKEENESLRRDRDYWRRQAGGDQDFGEKSLSLAERAAQMAVRTIQRQHAERDDREERDQRDSRPDRDERADDRERRHRR